jgi:hypothetical protein
MRIRAKSAAPQRTEGKKPKCLEKAAREKGLRSIFEASGIFPHPLSNRRVVKAGFAIWATRASAGKSAGDIGPGLDMRQLSY